LPLQIYLAYFFKWPAIILFVLLALSDWLDGYLARRYDWGSDLGKFLDPLADKILVTGLLIVFLQKGFIDVVSLVILISREFMVQGLRMMILEKGSKEVGASMTAKYKTVFLMLGIFFMLLSQLLLGQIFYYLGCLLAIISMVEYFWRNRRLLNA